MTRGRRLGRAAAYIGLAVAGAFGFHQMEVQRDRDIRAALVEGCQTRGNPLREVVGEILTTAAQARTDSAKNESAADPKQAKIDRKAARKYARLHRKIPLADCQKAYPKP